MHQALNREVSLVRRAKLYVVAWRFNDRVFTEEFEKQYEAEIKMIQLRAFQLNPTLHVK